MVLKFLDTKKTQQFLLIFILVVLTIPTFWAMLKFGIFTMHDFHVFRAFEFHKCILDFQIPCRWAPDSGFEYGEPLFNFYGQLSYFLTEPAYLLGLSIINSVKTAFIFAVKNPKIFPIVLLFWLIVAPIPAALTKEGFHANRAVTFLPVFSLISAYGAVNLVEFLKKKWGINLVPIFIIIILVAAVYILQNYFLHLPKRPAESARYGYKEAIAFTESVKEILKE